MHLCQLDLQSKNILPVNILYFVTVTDPRDHLYCINLPANVKSPSGRNKYQKQKPTSQSCLRQRDPKPKYTKVRIA